MFFDGVDVPCRGRSDLFFPEEVRSAVGRAILVEAREVCFGCEVREECLEYALQFEEWGIWGGMSEQERNRLRRKRGIRFLNVSTRRSSRQKSVKKS